MDPLKPFLSGLASWAFRTVRTSVSEAHGGPSFSFSLPDRVAAVISRFRPQIG